MSPTCTAGHYNNVLQCTMCTVHWDYLFSSPKRRVQGPVHLQQYVYLLRTNHLCTRWWPLQEADTPTLYRLIQAGTWRAADTFTNLYCRLPVILPFSPPVQCPTYPFPSSSPSHMVYQPTFLDVLLYLMYLLHSLPSTYHHPSGSSNATFRP